MTIALIIAVVVVQALDLATTLYAMKQGLCELNPLLRDRYGKLIVWRGVAFKSGVTLLIGYLLLQGFGTEINLLLTAVCVVPTLYVGIRNLMLLHDTRTLRKRS